MILNDISAAFKKLGVCKCGKDATALLKQGIAPGEWSKEEPICDKCSSRAFNALLDDGKFLETCPQRTLIT
jgi:hypothetical protein